MNKLSQEYTECLNCQAENEREEKYCWNCGYELKKPRSSDENILKLAGFCKFLELDKSLTKMSKKKSIR